MDFKLIPPDKRYAQSFAIMAQDFYIHKETGKYHVFKPGLDNFLNYIKTKQEEALGINLPEGFVSAQTYWLTDEQGIIYGTIRYQPVLNKQLLEMGGHIGFDIAPAHRRKGYGTLILHLLLEQIDRRENNNLLLTCDAGNIGSGKIIESNGGVAEPELYTMSDGKRICCYWINLS